MSAAATAGKWPFTAARRWSITARAPAGKPLKLSRTFLAGLALAGCGSAPVPDNMAPAPNAAPATPASAAPTPAFDSAIDENKLVLLCDPERFRVSVRYRADAASVDRSYARRVLIDPFTLVARFPHQGGEDQYQDGLVRYERCGPFVIRLQGDFLNGNIEGEMGGITPFAAVRIWADNRTLYPANERRMTRLAVCDERLPIWASCPADYAARIDLAYRPQVERLAIHEWALSGDILDDDGVYRSTERRSDVRAQLDLWWSRRH
jgi:hypothetical protein